jgi:hypothetical protein
MQKKTRERNNKAGEIKARSRRCMLSKNKQSESVSFMEIS